MKKNQLSFDGKTLTNYMPKCRRLYNGNEWTYFWDLKKFGIISIVTLLSGKLWQLEKFAAKYDGWTDLMKLNVPTIFLYLPSLVQGGAKYNNPLI